MVEFRCPSCNTPLATTLAKCPSCGLPLKPQASQSRGRSVFAAFLLLALFAVGSLQVGLILADPDEAIRPGNWFGVGSFEVTGVVRDANGTAVSNATVILESGADNATHRNTTTDVAGTYRFEDVAIGVYDVNATADNRTTLVRITVRQNEGAVDLALPANPGAVRGEHASLDFTRLWLRVCGGLLLGLCGVTLLGTIAAYRRRFWGMALAGAIAGAFLWVPLSLLLGLVAIVLLVKGRSEFA